MSFPFAPFDAILAEAKAIVANRDQSGRNDNRSFFDGFPHKDQDVSFELSRRVNRILGAEVRETHEGIALTAIKRGDALDLLAYAAFYIMLLDRASCEPPHDSRQCDLFGHD